MNMPSNPVVFALPPYKAWTKTFPCPLGRFSFRRFPNGELQLEVLSLVKHRQCVVIGTLNPPEINLFRFLVLCHTLKKEGAQKVTAFVPYLAYSRQERAESHKSQIAALVGRLLQAAGIDEVVTIDVHNRFIEKLFPIPILSRSPKSIFARELKKILWESFTLVAPDHGALERCTDVAKCLDLTGHVAWLMKERHARGVSHSEIHGSIGKRVVLIDDILDTGQTLISSCQKLIEQGAREMIVMVTHGLFTGNEWKKLWDLGVQKIYCTDTVPLDPSLLQERRIHVLPIGEDVWKS